jgi:hypothetical protein
MAEMLVFIETRLLPRLAASISGHVLRKIKEEIDG